MSAFDNPGLIYPDCAQRPTIMTISFYVGTLCPGSFCIGSLVFFIDTVKVILTKEVLIRDIVSQQNYFLEIKKVILNRA